MWIDKFETYILNIVGLQSRSTKKTINENLQKCSILRIISIQHY